MIFSGKIFFKIILKVTKNQGSTVSIEDTFFKKPHGGGGSQFDRPPGRLGLKLRSILDIRITYITFDFW